MAPKRKTRVEVGEDTRRKSARISESVAPPGRRTRAAPQATSPPPAPRNGKRKTSPTTQQSQSKRANTSAKELVPNAIGSRDQAIGQPPSKYFRVSGIPAAWSKDDILRALHIFDPSLVGRNPQISVYPACRGPKQIALLPLNSATECSRLPVPETDVELTIDNRFHDLTPLNTPTGEVMAESEPFFSA
jgi:hypothetical protein